MYLNNLFSKENVNTGRQVELDIAKALSIIFMVFLHTMWVVMNYNQALSPVYEFVVGNVLGRPYAAPIFMFCMGVGIVYSRHSQWDVMIKRGVKLYLLGILVNIFEWFIPHFLSGTLLGNWDAFLYLRTFAVLCRHLGICRFVIHCYGNPEEIRGFKQEADSHCSCHVHNRNIIEGD